MRILRTDEARFQGLPDYPFPPNYLEVAPGLRMHYVDAGPGKASPVLMLHGEPTWSYLYRHMIPPVAAAGYRVLAPDLIGFGKSDKPAAPEDYSYDAHTRWLSHWIQALGLRDITLVCQNWGSLLGLRLATELPDRFCRIIIGNGMLPTGDSRLPVLLTIWRLLASHSPWFPIGRIVQLGTERPLTRAELAAYEAPFPSAGYKAGVRAFPGLIPGSARAPSSHISRRIWAALEQWRKPFITCFSSGDIMTRGHDRQMQRRIPGAYGQPHVTLRGGHFLQEDNPGPFARIIIDAMKSELAA